MKYDQTSAIIHSFYLDSPILLTHHNYDSTESIDVSTEHIQRLNSVRGTIMKKIKNIAQHSLKLGFVKESETILRDLVDTQCQELGLLHEDTLTSIEMWAETLALLNRWTDLAEIHQLLSKAQTEIADGKLKNTIDLIDHLRTFERQSS